VSETILRERYPLLAPLPARLGGDAYLAEDEEQAPDLVEVHRIPAADMRPGAVESVQRAIDVLGRIPRGPLARPLRLLAPDQEGRMLLVVEHHPGALLSDLLAERGAPSPACGGVWIRSILQALAAAGRLGLAHGALSAERVRIGSAGQASLLDVGLEGLLDGGSDGDAAGRDLRAFAKLAWKLLGGEAPDAPGATGSLSPEASEQVGQQFLAALAKLCRNEDPPPGGDAAVGDQLARLLSLLPTRQEPRRPRFAVEEVWDGDLGEGTDRLLGLASRPELRGRMPALIRGQRTQDMLPADSAQELKFVDSGFMNLSRGDRQRLEMSPALELPAPARDLAESGDPDDTPDPSGPYPAVSPGSPVPPRGSPPPASPPPARPPLGPGATPAADSPFDVTPKLGIPARHAAVPPAPMDETAPLRREHQSTPPTITAGGSPVARLPDSMLVWSPRAPHVHYLIPCAEDAEATMGRERGNGVILRAFRRGSVENVRSNRISRRHLTMRRVNDRLLLADNRSTYGTSLDGARLKPGIETPIPEVRTCRIELAKSVVAFEGQAFPDARALRLARMDETSHHYIFLWQGAQVRLGSDPAADVFLLPGARGVVPGHAWVAMDSVSGTFRIAAREGPVKVGDRQLEPDTWAILGADPVYVGEFAFRARKVHDVDFLTPASGLAR
jgi:FHA domain